MAIPSSKPSFAFDSSSFPPLSSSRPPPLSSVSSDGTCANDKGSGVDPNHPRSGVDLNKSTAYDGTRATDDQSRQDPIRSTSNLNGKLDFASLFRSLPRNAGHYEPIQFDINKDGSLPDLVKEEGLKYWNNTLIGFFLDGTLPYSAVVSFLKARWKLIGDFSVKSDGYSFYIQFTNDLDRAKILRSDPIFIRGRMFIISQWDPTIGNSQKLIQKVPIWIHFSNIPLLLWTLVGINWIACHVGRLICFDYSTEKLQRFSYAKALVEISPEAELPNSIQLTCLSDCPTVRLSYEWKPNICVSCKCFGHRTVDCVSGDKVDEVNVDHNDVINEEYHGNNFDNHFKRTNKSGYKGKGRTRVVSKNNMYWRRKNVENVNKEEIKPDSNIVEEDLYKNAATKDSNIGGTDIDVNTVNSDINCDNIGGTDNVNTEDFGNIVGTDNVGGSDIVNTVNSEAGGKVNGKVRNDKVGSSLNAKGSQLNKDANFEITGDFGLNSLFNEVRTEEVRSRSSAKASSASISSQASKASKVSKESGSSSIIKPVGYSSSAHTSSSPYIHLKPPSNIQLPPPAVSGAGLTFPVIDQSLLSTAVPKSSLASSRSTTVKLKGKFWADDLDEGVEFTPEEVFPFSSNLKHSRRHTRKNPLYDPSFA